MPSTSGLQPTQRPATQRVSPGLVSAQPRQRWVLVANRCGLITADVTIWVTLYAGTSHTLLAIGTDLNAIKVTSTPDAFTEDSTADRSRAISIAAFLSQWVAFEAHSIEAVLKIAKVTFSSLTWSAGPRVAVTDGPMEATPHPRCPASPGTLG